MKTKIYSLKVKDDKQSKDVTGFNRINSSLNSCTKKISIAKHLKKLKAEKRANVNFKKNR